MRYAFIFTAAAAVLAGCTHYSVVKAPAAAMDPGSFASADAAAICVVRPHDFGALVPILVRDNGRVVGATKGASFFCYPAAPGAHTIVAEGGDDIDRTIDTLNIDREQIVVAAGERRFLHQDAQNVLGLGPLHWIDEASARALIPLCDWAELEGFTGPDARRRAPVQSASR